MKNRGELIQISAEHINPTVIRPASTEDLPTIELILRNTVQNPYGSGKVDEGEVQMELERIKKALASPSEDATLIAQSEHKTVGFAFFGLPDPRLTAFTGSNPITTLELKLLYVDTTRRNSGVGSQLLEAVEQEAKRRHKSKIELTSGPRYILIGSGRFYLKKGFRLAGTIQNYFDGGFWAKVFQKELV